MKWPTTVMEDLDAVSSAALWSAHVESNAPGNAEAMLGEFAGRGIERADEVISPMPVPANPFLMPAGLRRVTQSATRSNSHALLVREHTGDLSLYCTASGRSVSLVAGKREIGGWSNLPGRHAFHASFTPTHWNHLQEIACAERCLPRVVFLAENQDDAWAAAAVGREWRAPRACREVCGREDCRRVMRPCAAVNAGPAFFWAAWTRVLLGYLPALTTVIIIPSTETGWVDRRLAAFATLGRTLAQAGVQTTVMPWAWIAREVTADWGPGGLADLLAARGATECAELVGKACSSVEGGARAA